MTTKTQKIFELSAPYANPYQGTRRRKLFVCSAGLLRSPTAAAVAISLGHNARSCGSATYALVPLSANLIYWAEDIYFVNEANYLEAKIALAGEEDLWMEVMGKLKVWDIEDEFDYMDPSLVSICIKHLEKH